MADRRLPLLAAAALLVGVSLTGCSGRSYCETLKDDKPRLTQLAKQSARSDAKGTAGLSETVKVLADLRDAAPDDISEDWDTLVDALDGLATAVRASGVGPGEFGAGKRPRGVTGGDYTAVRQAAAELQATPVQQASSSIEQHAQDVCKVDLGSGLRGTT